jgi:hypothetical protein
MTSALPFRWPTDKDGMSLSMRLAIEQRECHSPSSTGLSRLLKQSYVRSPESVDLNHFCLQCPFDNQYTRVELDLIDCVSFLRQAITF